MARQISLAPMRQSDSISFVRSEVRKCNPWTAAVGMACYRKLVDGYGTSDMQAIRAQAEVSRTALRRPAGTDCERLRESRSPVLGRNPVALAGRLRDVTRWSSPSLRRVGCRGG